MPPRGVTKGTERARQYEHIKTSEKAHGRSTRRAEEIAAPSAESRTRPRGSLRGPSAGERGRRRSGTRRPQSRTRGQLYHEAKKLNVRGRSPMTKAHLKRAVDSPK